MLYIGADHRGYKLKEELKEYLTELGYEFEDLGNQKYDPDDDYPDFAALVGERVSANPEENSGVLICGSGSGVDVVANKFKGIRASIAINAEQMKMSKAHDNINVLAIASDFTLSGEVKEIVKVWLETPVSQEERHKRRISKISELEKKL